MTRPAAAGLVFFRKGTGADARTRAAGFAGEFHPRAAFSVGVLMPRGSCSGRRPVWRSAWGLLMGRMPRSGSAFWLLSGQRRRDSVP